MTASTRDKLIAAASGLLDHGGLSAVTLRAVAEQVGVSHNAPYRHFRDRSAILAAVAEHDFVALRQMFAGDGKNEDARSALRSAVTAFADWGLTHPSRYRLLFSDPELSPDPALKAAALALFATLQALVERCQAAGALPQTDSLTLAGLIYAVVHGAMDLQLGGRANAQKGLGDIAESFDLFLRLIKSP